MICQKCEGKIPKTSIEITEKEESEMIVLSATCEHCNTENFTIVHFEEFQPM